MVSPVKIIEIPVKLDLSYDSEIWDLLKSKAFSKLRCGGKDRLTTAEINFLREKFEKFTSIREQGDGNYDELFAVGEKEKISDSMLLKASYDLTRQVFRS